MDIFVRVIAFSRTLGALAALVFMCRLHQQTCRMRRINSHLSLYLKDKSFLYMSNEGDDPCDISRDFPLIEFSQKVNYLVKR